MNKLNVLLISTTKDIENKIDLVLNMLKKSAIKTKIYLYTNINIDKIKNIEVVVLNENKNELINQGLKSLQENTCIINLDYGLKTIKKCFEKILENFKDVDIINFKHKKGKIQSFFSKIIFLVYNFILSVFNLSKLLDINYDFQFLSTKVMKVIYNIEKSPNYLRAFDNFNGYNVLHIEEIDEKVKYKTNNKFFILALILLSLVIISLAAFVFVLIVKNNSPKISQVILLEIIVCIVTIGCMAASFTYHKYLNSI